MGPVSNPRDGFAGRSVVRTFGLFATLPLGLAVLELLFADVLPEAVISAVELPYTLLVYLPTAVVGAVVFEPLGVPELLDTVPFAPEIMLVTALVAFYYLVTLAVVTGVSLVRRATGG